MAKSNKIRTDSDKGKKSAPKSTKKTKPVLEPSLPPSHSREITAVIFLLLAFFLIISAFNTDGGVIRFLAELVGGLIGWGYWLSVPSLILASVLLFTHKDKPVGMRLTAALLLPLIFAALGQLIFGQPMWGSFEFQKSVGILFEQGKSMKSGGVLGGLLGIGFEAAFSVYGAVPLLLAAFAALLILALRGRFSGLIKPREKKPQVINPEPPQILNAEDEKPSGGRHKKERKSKSDEINKSEAMNIHRTIPEIEFMPPENSVNSKADAFMDIPLGDDDDSLGFNNLDFGEDSGIADRKSAVKLRNGRKKASQDAGAMEKFGIFDEAPVEPEGKKLNDGFIDLPVESFKIPQPVTLSAEISDPPKRKKIRKKEIEEQVREVEAQMSPVTDSTGYTFPPMELLKTAPGAQNAGEEILINRDRLETALRSFGINAGISGVISGPTVTRYDVELEQGVKLSKITNLAGDLALSLGVANVRIAPIPDKISTVGIEVPNKIVSTVYLRDVIDTPKFRNAKSKLSFAIGKDISGECIVGNISKLPHMLIAGTTGSGKSVCMNCLILSILYKARPDEVRLIMIDPKMVELGIYNGIPHLFVPVVTDPKKAAGALEWSVVEMLKRYRLFSEAGVRDIANYNKNCTANGEETMPRIVIVIDELADLMMAASKEVEESICRVAQMGRAAGMHLIIATQRPSADVITGLMKANIPSRIAFAVSSSMESRIILDQSGAEKLIGMGDMLFSPVGCRKPIRIQGAFVTDEEREEIIDFIKQGTEAASENNEIEEFMNKAAEDKGSDSKTDDRGDASDEYDEMLPKAVEVVLEMGSCSVSMLQRRVKLGYSRAARIVDQMEELGIVGPYEGAKPRQVLIDRAGWHDIQVELGLVEDDMAIAAQMSESLEQNYDD